MYAIVKTGGKQYRVERGQTLLVERLKADEGAEMQLEPILYRSEEPIFDKEGLAGVKVTAKVLAHVRGEKLRVFKFKPKRGYKRRTGHRQDLTRIEVLDISHGKPKAARKAPAEKAEGKAPAEGAPAAAGEATAAPVRAKAVPKAEKPKTEKPKAKADAAKATGEAKASGEAKAAKPKADKPKAKPAKPKAEKPKAKGDA
jgi:large subunit ribosomal protein L21